MPRAERERTAVCATSCRNQGFKDLCPLPAVHLSWCSTWRYCGRFTAHPWLLYHSFPFFTAKISCYILVKVLVHKGKLQVAYKSATCNLSLWIKARTEHACLKASEFLDVHASLSPSCLLYKVGLSIPVVRLRPTPLWSVIRSVIIQTPLADVNKLILANDDSMPKYQHEKIACPCHKPSRLTLRWLASRTFNILVLCRYSRPATTSLPTHSFLVLSSTFIIYMIFLLYWLHRYFSNQHCDRHISCKISRYETIVKFCLRSGDCEQSSFPREKSILHT